MELAAFETPMPMTTDRMHEKHQDMDLNMAHGASLDRVETHRPPLLLLP